MEWWQDDLEWSFLAHIYIGADNAACVHAMQATGLFCTYEE